MRFSIDHTELQKAVTTILKGVSIRSTLPVLSGILLDAKKESLILQSTDLEQSIKYTLPALVEEEGRTVIPGKLFSDIVKNLPDAAVHIKEENDQATITCDNASFSVKTLRAEDFPEFPEVEPQQTISIPFETFSSMVKHVAKTVSNNFSSQ